MPAVVAPDSRINTEMPLDKSTLKVNQTWVMEKQSGKFKIISQ